MLGGIKRWFLRRLPTSWAGHLRAWNIRRIIRTFKPAVVEHSYGGRKLQVYLADPLARGWYDHDWDELPEISYLKQHRLRPGACVFDIGAHQGVVAAMLASEVGATGTVIAIEGSLHNCKAAEKTAELNRMPQIQVIHAAIADRLGTIEFTEGLNGQLDDGSSSLGRVQVTALTVDALADQFRTPDVVFLDVEGAEWLALRGARKVLDSGADFFVEVHVGHGLEKLGGDVRQVLAHFPPQDFHLVVRAENDPAFRPLQADDPLLGDRFFLIATRR